MKTVVIVDDSHYMRSLLKATLTRGGFEIVGEASDGKEAVDLVLTHKPDIVTLDNILPDMFGVEIMQALIDKGVKSKIVMISAVGTDQVVNEVMDIGASEFIIKPFSPEHVIEVIRGVAA